MKTKSIIALMFIVLVAGILIGYLIFSDNSSYSDEKNRSTKDEAASNYQGISKVAREASVGQKEIQPQKDSIDKYHLRVKKKIEFLVSEDNFKTDISIKLDPLITKVDVLKWDTDLRNKVQLYRLTAFDIWRVKNSRNKNYQLESIMRLASYFSCDDYNNLYTNKQKHFLGGVIIDFATQDIIPNEIVSCEPLYSGGGQLCKDAISRKLNPK